MKKNGFTLIELVVVLAIIGVIIAIAIIGVNGSQQNARNTARKTFGQNLNAQILIWIQKNGVPPTSSQFYSKLGSTFIDPTITCQNGISANSRCIGTSGLTLGNVLTTTGTGCSISTPTTDSKSINICYDGTVGNNGYTFVVYLEGGTAYKVAY